METISVLKSEYSIKLKLLKPQFKRENFKQTKIVLASFLDQVSSSTHMHNIKRKAVTYKIKTRKFMMIHIGGV